MTQGRQIRETDIEIVDMTTRQVLGAGRWVHGLVQDIVRPILEREGRARADTLEVRGGQWLHVDDGTSVDREDYLADIRTGDGLARLALSEPMIIEVEPPVGLDPFPFGFAEYDALPEGKLELIDGGLFDGGQIRATMTRALLANMGLRAIVKLAPRELWLEALNE